MLSPIAVVGSLEVVLILAGLVVLWRVALSPAARARPAPVLLHRWEISPLNVLILIWGMFTGGLLIQFLASYLLKFIEILTPQMRLMLASAATDCCMVAVWLFGKPRLESRPDPVSGNAFTKIPWTGGGLTFLAAWPVVFLTMFVWQNGLKALGMPMENQEAIDMFINARQPLWLAFLFSFAVILAPITEELIFRGALFNFARGRLPRWFALLGPACLFSAAHNMNLASFLPLVALAVVFSMAYERTGDIRVTIIAHGLYNLNTAIMVLAGIGGGDSAR